VFLKVTTLPIAAYFILNHFVISCKSIHHFLVGKFYLVDVGYACCNTLGVYHQLSSGFKLKHDRLVEMTMSKSNLWK
jgi:hypothetical protein